MSIDYNNAQHNIQMIRNHAVEDLRADSTGKLQVKSRVYRFFTTLLFRQKKESEKVRDIICDSLNFAKLHENDSEKIQIKVTGIGTDSTPVTYNLGTVLNKIEKILEGTLDIPETLLSQKGEVESLKNQLRDLPNSNRVTFLCEGVQQAAKTNKNEVLEFFLSKIQEILKENKDPLLEQACGYALETCCKENNLEAASLILEKIETIPEQSVFSSILRAVENKNEPLFYLLLQNNKERLTETSYSLIEVISQKLGWERLMPER